MKNEKRESNDICPYCGGLLSQPDLSDCPDHAIAEAPDLVCDNCGEAVYEDFWRKLGNSTKTIEMVSTPARLYILIANIQLALRHPDNTGASAAIAKSIAVNMTDAICHHFPEARETIEQGWHAAYDVTKDYFKDEFELGAIMQKIEAHFD